ncbi:MAG: N-glycosylase/DNA lyase [Candidatus Bathyarchaeia archaeon]
MAKSTLELQALVASKRQIVRRRLQEFANMLFSPPEEIFAELCFCICTPQSKAELCDLAVRELENHNLLMHGPWDQVRNVLHGVRFRNVKARRIVKARRLFRGVAASSTLSMLRSNMDPPTLREWLITEVDGVGMKEASHFLRNIGLGSELAILDRHILRSLSEYEILPTVPHYLSAKRYVKIEERMKLFAQKLNVSLEELDLLLWWKETGRIFK